MGIASEQQNNAQAMFNLAYMHELGHGKKCFFLKNMYIVECVNFGRFPISQVVSSQKIYFSQKCGSNKVTSH